MPLMTTTGQFSQVVDAAVRALFDKHLEEQSSQLYYSSLGFQDWEPDVPSAQLTTISGPGRGGLTSEGQIYISNTKTKGYAVTATLRKYTSELSWTEEDLHWLNKANTSSKQTIDLKDISSGAVQALYQNINEDSCKALYLGFGTTFLTTGNSEALFGSHTIIADGSSQKNTFPTGSTHKALSGDALVEAINIMFRFKNMNAIQLRRPLKLKLVVSPELEAEAIRIVNSEYGPANNNLGLQTAGPTVVSKRGMSIEVTAAPDILYAYRNYWFLIDTERAKNRFLMAWGWKPRMNDVTDFQKGVYKNEASTYFGPVCNGWQFAFGSKGDGTAS